VIALDTNVVLRVLTRDEPRQARLAARVLRSERLRLAKSVLLEAEWVLRFSHRQSRAAIAEGFRTLLGYPRLEVEDRGAVVRALAWYESGLDFADALHLASAGAAMTFVTFDQELARQAVELTDAPSVELLRAARGRP
jgi:predicted nucleic-acid-binding protein